MILKATSSSGRLTIEGEFKLPFERLTENVTKELNLATKQLGADMHKI